MSISISQFIFPLSSLDIHLFVLYVCVSISASVQFNSVQSLSRVWLFATLWIAGHQASCPSPAPGAVQTHVHWVGDAFQPSHPLSFPSPAFNLSQHQDLFQWASSLHQVAKVLELQLQHQSFQWIFRIFSEVSSVQFSCSVVSNSLRPHELQHARPPVHHQLPKFTQTHVHRVGDAIQPSHPLSSPSPPYNRILLSHTKEQNWVICRDMHGPRDGHTEWSKSEREKQILYINAYMQDLKKLV